MQFLCCNSPITRVIKESRRQCALRCCPFILNKTCWWKRCSKPGEIQEKSNRDRCYPLLWKSGARCHYCTLADDAQAAKGDLTPLATTYYSKGWPRFACGSLSPLHPIAPQCSSPGSIVPPQGMAMGGTEWRDTLAGLPGWLAVGCAERGASQGEGKGVGPAEHPPARGHEPLLLPRVQGEGLSHRPVSVGH